MPAGAWPMDDTATSAPRAVTAQRSMLRSPVGVTLTGAVHCSGFVSAVGPANAGTVAVRSSILGPFAVLPSGPALRMLRHRIREEDAPQLPRRAAVERPIALALEDQRLEDTDIAVATPVGDIGVAAGRPGLAAQRRGRCVTGVLLIEEAGQRGEVP